MRITCDCRAIRTSEKTTEDTESTETIVPAWKFIEEKRAVWECNGPWRNLTLSVLDVLVGGHGIEMTWCAATRGARLLPF